MPGSCIARPVKACATSARRFAPPSPLLCRCISNPPVAPSAKIAGALKAIASPSLKPPVLPKNSPTRACAGTLRSSQCLKVTKIVAALLRKVPPPMKSKPVNATQFSMFGFSRTVATTFCTISSVRSRDEPSGSSTTAM